MGALRLCSFNIRNGDADDGPNSWPHRAEALAELLNKLDADIFGLQEVLSYQLDFLLEALPSHSSIGVGRLDGKRNGEFAPIFYRQGLLEATDSGHFWLSETPDLPGSMSWNTACERLCTWADFGRFTLMNTHLDHASPEARRHGSRLIVSRAPSGPAVLMGDFNSTSADDPIQEIVMAGFVDSGTHLAGSTFHDWRKQEGGRIDYIFGRGVELRPAQVITQEVHGRDVSDHFAVITDMDWEQD